MRIHSSSLAFSPVGLNQKVSRNNNGQDNEGQNFPSDAKDALSKKPFTPEEIKKTLDNVGLAVDLSGQDYVVKPINSRTLRALSAYTQELNAPLQDQRAQLIAGIDVYA